MKVLFICRQNIGRSQMAVSIFNKYIKNSYADSRGTMVEIEGMTLEELGAKNTIRALQENENVDARNLKSIQLKQVDLLNYDHIIVMSEIKKTPYWLEHSSKAERWDIPDTKTSDYETTVEVLHDIKKLVLERFSSNK
jgi:protein-tyrosine-phosphatase